MTVMNEAINPVQAVQMAFQRAWVSPCRKCSDAGPARRRRHHRSCVLRAAGIARRVHVALVRFAERLACCGSYRWAGVPVEPGEILPKLCTKAARPWLDWFIRERCAGSAHRLLDLLDALAPVAVAGAVPARPLRFPDLLVTKLRLARGFPELYVDGWRVWTVGRDEVCHGSLLAREQPPLAPIPAWPPAATPLEILSVKSFVFHAKAYGVNAQRWYLFLHDGDGPLRDGTAMNLLRVLLKANVLRVVGLTSRWGRRVLFGRWRSPDLVPIARAITSPG